MESGEDAFPVVHQDVSAQGDAYVAGRDIHNHSSRVQNIYFPARSDIEKIADELAAVVLAEAQTARSRLVGPGKPGDAAANVRYVKSAGRFREVGGEVTSDLSGVLRFYQSLSPQRLVVLGGPGAGKTVLALELQVLLLEARRDAPGGGLRSPVPVMFSASAYRTDTPWEDWLAGQLALRFGIRNPTAARLVRDGQILPLVDGLDEMDPADAEPKRAQALVRALNEMVRGRDRAPVVVTSRPGEYEALTRQIDRATHVEMTGLTASEAVTYLRGQFLGPDEQERWQPVLTDLEAHPDGPLAGQLTTPWRLTLALAAFRDRGDPGTLFPPPGVSGDNYSRYVGRLLLGDYVPAAVRRYGTGTAYSETRSGAGSRPLPAA